MAVRLVFLGRLADVAEADEIAVNVPTSLEELFAGLSPPLAKALKASNIRMALNGALLAPGAIPMLADGDELAFLPPVSGG